MLEEPIFIQNYGFVARIPSSGIALFQIDKAFARQIFDDPIHTDESQTPNGLMFKRTVGNRNEQVVLGPQRIEAQTFELADTIRIVSNCMDVYRDQNYLLETTAHGINFNIQFNNDGDLDPSIWISQHFLSETIAPETNNIEAQIISVRMPNFGNSTYMDITLSPSSTPDYNFSCHVNFHHEEIRTEVIHGEELEDLILQCYNAISDELRRLFNTEE